MMGIILLFLCGDHSVGDYGIERASTSDKYGANFYTDSSQYTGMAAMLHAMLSQS